MGRVITEAVSHKGVIITNLCGKHLHALFRKCQEKDISLNDL